MRKMFGTVGGTALIVVGILLINGTGGLAAQSGNNPYRLVEGLGYEGPARIGAPQGPWAKLPDGREMGAVGGVYVDIDGEHIWAAVRCDADVSYFGRECLDSDLDVIYKFHPDGHVVESFGAGMFIWPHGITVDKEGNVWVTDSAGAGVSEGDTRNRGHQVIKFSPTGEVLLTLGTRGVPGSGPDHLNAPSDVVVAPNGDIFVADGHNTNGNNRVVKYSPGGEFIKEFGGTGYGPGQIRGPHAIEMDSRGRIFVGDRENNRIQIFDQEGNFLATWTQFGKPSGIFIGDDDRIYVADSESDPVSNPGWEKGIRIGEIETGWVTHFIPEPGDNALPNSSAGPEFLAADRHGNLYGANPLSRRLDKYVRIRPLGP
jgi:hypothetical protein